MTDSSVTVEQAAGGLHTSEAAKARLRARYRSEDRFRWTGAAAVAVAAMFLVILLSTIITQAIPAFHNNYLRLPVDLASADVDRQNLATADFTSSVNKAVLDMFPAVSSRQDRRAVRGLISTGSSLVVREAVKTDLGLLDGTAEIIVPLDDFADLYFKGLIGQKDLPVSLPGRATPTGTEGDISVVLESNAFQPLLGELKNELRAQAGDLEQQAQGRERQLARQNSLLDSLKASQGSVSGEEAQNLQRRVEETTAAVSALNREIENLREQAADLLKRASEASEREPLTSGFASYLININGGVIKLTAVSPDVAEGVALQTLESADPADAGRWTMTRIATPESERKLSDREIVWLDALESQDRVENHWNSIFFFSGASREPELAGIWGAVVGSALTMITTLLLAFPIGVGAAIYLEEFAPKNRITAIIEVNINNLAAVPSIVFGLLGLAVFLNWFNLPRSAPLVGGMVLALMTLPTIIIASRAALKAVPPSIREAALGVGASKVQTVFHHVLPLAMPGIFTGTIIGMAQALGETAPLLMIGMVAFIVDIPGALTDPATVLPVQIFMWADFPEPAFQQKTSAAILILLAFLVVMNAIAVLLRRRFERRW